MFELADVVPAPDGGSGGCSDAGIPVDPANRTTNPSFEMGLSGWGKSDAELSHQPIEGAPHGCDVARVTFDGSSDEGSYYIKDDPRTFESVAGATYRAVAWVRYAPEVARPDSKVTVAISIQESDGQLASTSVQVGSSTFTQVETSGTAEGGYTLGVRVTQSAAVAGDAIEVDLVQMMEELPAARTGP